MKVAEDIWHILETSYYGFYDLLFVYGGGWDLAEWL